MEHRVFGRELTNLLDNEHHNRYKRNYSLIHHDKLNQLRAPVSTRNRSIILPKTLESKPETPAITNNTQMVTEYFD